MTQATNEMSPSRLRKINIFNRGLEIFCTVSILAALAFDIIPDYLEASSIYSELEEEKAIMQQLVPEMIELIPADEISDFFYGYPILLAVLCDVETVNRCLEMGADIHQRGSSDQTTLTIASQACFMFFLGPAIFMSST